MARRLIANFDVSPDIEDTPTQSLDLMVCERVDVSNMLIAWPQRRMSEAGADPHAILTELLAQLQPLTFLQ